MNNRQRYEELKARFDASIDTGQPAISSEEAQERIRLHYELNGVEVPEFTVPIATSSSNPRDGGIIFYPRKHLG